MQGRFNILQASLLVMCSPRSNIAPWCSPVVLVIRDEEVNKSPGRKHAPRTEVTLYSSSKERLTFVLLCIGVTSRLFVLTVGHRSGNAS